MSSDPYRLLLVSAAVGGSLLCGYLLLRRYLAGRRCTSNVLLEGKVAIITGANSGIGKELALDFACRKARVIIACRSQEKAEKAVVEIKRKSNNNDVIFRQLDLSSLDSVRHFSSIIHEEEAKVDILVNNAGLMGCPYTRTQDGFEMHFGTNHLGHFLLTNLLLDCLEKAPAARIVTITSSLYKRCPGIKFDDLDHERAYDPMQAYAHSKLANILFIRALDRRLRGSKVTVNATHTAGMVRTELGRYTLEKASLWVKVLAPLLMHLLLKTPQQGAQPALHCALSVEMEGVSGKFMGDCREDRLQTSAAVDDEAAERLWQVSAQLVGLP